MIYKFFAYALVWPLQALTPLCFAAFPFAYATKTNKRNQWIRNLILGYTGIEIFFYIYYRRALRIAQVRQHPPRTSRERRDEIFKGIEDSAAEGESHYDFLKNWFSVSTLAHVSRHDLRQWLAWALFDRQYEEIVNVKDRQELEERISTGERAFAITIPDKACEDLPAAMRLSVDPVVADHRPLIYYTVTSLISLGADIFLMWRGFERHRIGPVFLWILKGVSVEDGGEPPMVFVHGVGIGLAAYIPYILKLSSENSSRYPRRTIVLIELPHVSMKLNVDTIPRMDVIAECAAIAFKQHNLSQALWVAHSLGTFVFAVVNRLQPELVAGVILVDPVCFLLWEPDLTRNFCYRIPVTPMQIIQSYHICRELSISYYFHRHFWWHECVQFAKQMPKKSLVYISEFDDIYNTKSVLSYLKRNNIQTEVLRGQQHGGWLVDGPTTDRLVASMHLSLI